MSISLIVCDYVEKKGALPKRGVLINNGSKGIISMDGTILKSVWEYTSIPDRGAMVVNSPSTSDFPRGD